VAKIGKMLFPQRMPHGRRRHRPNWVPVAAYVLFVLLVGGGLFAWDRAYEARQRALYAPASPPVLVRNMIESIVGAGTVTDVKIDDKAGTLDVTVKDVLVKPGQPLDEKKKNLSTEGALAIQFVQSRLRYKTMTVHLVQDGKALATVTATGQVAPKTDYAPDLK
jgi:hypothetical protein